MKGLRYLWCGFLITVCCALSAPAAHSQVEEFIDTREKRDVILYRGDLVSLKVYSLTRVAISTPGIVDIVNADVDEILLVGNNLGQTQIFIWDEYGKRSVLARVMETDLDMIKERIEQLLNSAGIKGVTLEGSAYEAKIIATGKVNKSQKDLFDKVILDFGSYVINMVDAQGDLIQIDAQVTELSTTLEKTLGVQWMGSFDIEESSGPTPGTTNIFKVVNMNRLDLIRATVNALLTTGEARTLSRPSIVMSDGETANISVGGEIPITSAVFQEGGVVTETITYKTYGLQFSVTPEIRDNEKVDINLMVSIIDPDSNLGDGSFLTTQAQTKVLMDDGQTIIIAGLIKKNESVTETKVPFLSSIPILGMAFRNKKHVKAPDREIVISLTPHIRRQGNNLKTARELEEEALIKKQAEIRQAAEEDPFLTERLRRLKDGFQGPDPLLEEELDAVLKGDQGQEGATSKEGAGQTDGMSKDDQDLDAILKGIEKAAMREPHPYGMGDVSGVLTEYAKDVQKKIAQRISYPYQAKEAGWEGVVTLSLKILSDGQLNDVSVKESSGRSIFDSDAVNTAKIVSPYAPFPMEIEMDEITIFIPVTYSQDAFLIK